MRALAKGNTMRPETPLPISGLAGDRAQAGFSLVEVLLTLGVTLLLFLGVLATLDVNSRVTRVQTHVADMQQSLRIAQNDMIRMIRMAGRGGLPAADAVAAPFPTGLALNVRDNVAAGQLLVAGDNDTLIQEGTDVVSVRGVFSTPIYQVDITSQNEQRTAGDFKLDAPLDNPPSGTLVVRAITPKGAPQDLGPLQQAINDVNNKGIAEALILGSSMDDTIYAVVELMSGSKINADNVEIRFQIRGGGSPLTDPYRSLSRGGDFPAELRSVAYAGILEQYSYYVRADRAIDGDPASELTPKLSRARLYPGTARAYANEDDNGRIDLADNILDLQVALGIDSSISGRTTDDANEIGIDDTIVEVATGTGDDWLLNGTADAPTDAFWRTNPPPSLFFLRVSTLARADRRDPGYQAPLLPARIENRAYAANSPFNSRGERMFRRRVLQTLIDLRNLS